MTLEKQERTLFYSIWIVVLLGLLIWKFYPRADQLGREDPPTVELGRELAERFTQASVTDPSLGHYAVELKLSPAYQSRLEEKVYSFALSYDLVGPQSVLFRGVAPCAIYARRGIASVELPNPYRISARTIRLHMAE